MNGKISRRNFSVSLLAAGLATPTVFALGKGSASQKSIPGNPSTSRPPGKFRIVYSAYRREGYDDMPVRVVDAVGMAMEEPLERRFSLKNFSTKPIRKLEVSMRVMIDKHAVMPVLHETRSSYAFAELLLPQREHMVKGQDKLKDLFGPLLVDGKLTGDYRVELFVTRVLFEDGSSWEAQEPGA